MKSKKDHLQEFYDVCYDSICTKPETRIRFLFGRTNQWNHSIDPFFYNSGARTVEVPQVLLREEVPELKVLYLKQDESALRTLKRGLIEELDYDPWNDIDRYLVKCLRGNVEGTRCPAWQKLREMCAVGECEQVFVEPSALVAVSDDDGVNGEPGRIYIGNGDGRVGPIASKENRCRRNPLAELARLCQFCEFARPPSVVDADASSDQTKKPDGEGEHVHSNGIITFFRRLFGRKERQA